MKYIQIFLILEKAKPVIWLNKTMIENSITIWTDKQWYFLINYILKKEIFFQNTILIEQSAIDNTLNNLFLKNINKFSLFNIYYSYFNKLRTILFSDTSINFYSVDSIFKNSCWLERETSEMYGLNTLFKRDSRKLLLDYSKIESPMLKDFPTENIKDIFYDILDNQVTINTNETVEL